MNKKWPIIIGIAVALVFSIYPIRYANAFCCMGIILAGMQGAVLRGRAQGFKLETTHALRVGASIGFGAAVIMLLINTLIGLTLKNWIVFDPVPSFMYTFFFRLIEGVIDIAGNAPSFTDYGGPGPMARFLFQIPSNVLFGGIGGAIGASLFRQETPIFQDPE